MYDEMGVSPVPESEIPIIPEYIPNRDETIKRHKYPLYCVESGPFNRSSIKYGLKYYNEEQVLTALKKGLDNHIHYNNKVLEKESKKPKDDICNFYDAILEELKDTKNKVKLLDEKGLEAYMETISD
ncbi:MAG: hypothetical protein KAS90_01515 [Candidatus Aenigmarchaeota archaeon]|nr:hypothetical protein [Candidatus Aenigmarchaeota archaeon]